MGIRSPRSYDLRRYPGFGLMTVICLGLLYLPIFVLVVFSFNERRSVSNWSEFSLDWYVKAIANDAIQQAATNSLLVAMVATMVATILATAAALATTRGRRFRGAESGRFVEVCAESERSTVCPQARHREARRSLDRIAGVLRCRKAAVSRRPLSFGLPAPICIAKRTTNNWSFGGGDHGTGGQARRPGVR